MGKTTKARMSAMTKATKTKKKMKSRKKKSTEATTKVIRRKKKEKLKKKKMIMSILTRLFLRNTGKRFFTNCPVRRKLPISNSPARKRKFLLI